MEQGERVHQLEGRADVDDPLVVGVAAGADESPVAERRAQSLAAGLHHPIDLVERTGEVGVERRPALPLGLDQGHQPLGRRVQRSWRDSPER